MWKKESFWWFVAIGWCIAIVFATRSSFFTGASTEKLLQNPFFDSFLLNIIFRKAVHVTAFGLLACFFFLARKTKRYAYTGAWLLATLYGAIDEWHQTFIPARDGLFSDVLLNSFGAIVALSGLYIFFTIKEKNQALKRHRKES